MRYHLEKDCGINDIQNVNFDDSEFYKHFNTKGSENYASIEKVMLNLALCHSIIIERRKDKVLYNSSSPDELALVYAAKFFGVTYKERDEENVVSIEFKGQTLKY